MSFAMVTSKSLSLFGAMGGWRTVIEAVVSRALFFVVYLLTDDVLVSAAVAVGGVLVLAVLRVRTDGKYWQAGVALGVVGFSALLAGTTGQGANFYLPDLVRAAAMGTAFLLSMLVRFPLIGIVVGVALGERLAWRKNRCQQQRYQLCTGVFVVKSAIILALLGPLYHAGNVAPLGVAATLLGAPATGLALYFCWRILRVHDERTG
ncbi:DUF3159 domain-containing protein [Kribbella sp. NPDC056951]|uniref:DUF3159 domain-containing protein n=1 Tax=Kribbella sp. NPDC056951 TaxID=3345978 RepID=UPI003630C482